MSEAVSHEVEVYQTEEGRSPFSEWIRNLKDLTARSRVRTRLTRLRLGNFGDTNSLGDGLHELLIDHGPGYRVYFSRAGDRLVLLFCGGTKRTQLWDIEQARTYWRDYRRRSL